MRTRTLADHGAAVTMSPGEEIRSKEETLRLNWSVMVPEAY
jgi:hypothetical protein